MSRSGRLWSATRTRRTVQLASLVLFVGLLLWVRSRADWEPGWTAKLYFLIDPLLLLATWLAAHAVPVALLASLAVVAVTLVAGRVFCGWVCPLGTIHAAAGRVLFWLWPNRKRRDHWSPWQRGKYYLLIAFLVMAALGGHWVAVFDPMVSLYRSSTTALLPGTQWAVEEGSKAVFDADPSVGRMKLTAVTEPAYNFLRDNIFTVPKQVFLGGGLILLLFVATLLLNRYRPRFWCRYLCPLGALLGVLSCRPLLRRVVDSETCNQCGLCGMACHGAAAAGPGEGWKPAECFGCLNCVQSCPRHSVRFTLASPLRRVPAAERVGLDRRGLMAAALGGVAGLCLLRITPQARGTSFNDALIRPPGARPEREFLERCTACGMCMKVCPTGGLQPACTEAGLEGLWTPRLVPRIGYCDYNCNLCGQVCPTEAIQPLSVEEKQQVRVGLAAFDTSRCIPYAYGRDCMVCEEHCPIPDKAIYFVEVEIQQRDGGEPKRVKQPHVDPEKCIGCGICENKCPFKDGPAIRVRSANESRHPENQPILPSAEGGGKSPYG